MRPISPARCCRWVGGIWGETNAASPGLGRTQGGSPEQPAGQQLVLYEDCRKISGKMGFKDAKSRVIKALENGDYSHEVRLNIDEKNKLQTGEVSADFVINIIKKCTGIDYETSPHHQDSSIDVHVLKKNSWYIKFYFVDPATVFISVHQ